MIKLLITEMEYRYSLLKGSKKYQCPGCGRRRFVPFVDHETGDILEDFGRCDRENNCGYYVRPEGGDSHDWKPQARPREESPVKLVDPSVMNATLKAYERNIFVQWMVWLIGYKPIAHELAIRWKIGTAKDGSAIFWQVDNKGNVYNAHKMEYLPTGKRNRDGANVHLFTAKDGFKTGLFGLHNVRGTQKPVAIVESEKTAVLASLYYPQYGWIATASANGLTTDKMNAVTGYKCILFPDADKAGRESFEKAKINLSKRGVNVELVDMFPDRSDGFDLADMIAEDLTGGAIQGESKIRGYPLFWDEVKV